MTLEKPVSFKKFDEEHQELENKLNEHLVVLNNLFKDMKDIYKLILARDAQYHKMQYENHIKAKDYKQQIEDMQKLSTKPVKERKYRARPINAYEWQVVKINQMYQYWLDNKVPKHKYELYANMNAEASTAIAESIVKQIENYGFTDVVNRAKKNKE